MSLHKLTLVTRRQGNNAALKDGIVKPRTFEPQHVEVDPIIAAFRRQVRNNEFDICEMAITTYICAREHGKHCQTTRTEDTNTNHGDKPGVTHAGTSSTINQS